MVKILVGCPTAEVKKYCLKEYVAAIKNLTYDNYDILLVDNSPDDNYLKTIESMKIPVIKDIRLDDVKERIVHSRNILREKFLAGDYDYFLSLEQDVIPPKDVIERLLSHKKEIVSGIYYTVYNINGKKVIRPLIWGEVKGKPEVMSFMGSEAKEGLTKPTLLEVKACGLGCILISKSVLEKIKFKASKETFDDIQFCLEAARLGYKVYADTGLHCKHLLGGDHNI